MAEKVWLSICRTVSIYERAVARNVSKKFRFEDPGDITGFYKDNLGLDDQIVLQDNIRRKIQEARCLLSI